MKGRVFLMMGGFALRHSLAIGLVVAAGAVLWTITYLVLLIYAFFTGSGLGGPLAYPALLLFFVFAGTALCLGFFLPATALAEWFVRRMQWNTFAQIPIGLAILWGLILGLILLVQGEMLRQSLIFGTSMLFGLIYFLQKDSAQQMIVLSFLLWLVLLLPMGLYWWAAQSGPLLWELAGKIRERLGYSRMAA